MSLREKLKKVENVLGTITVISLIVFIVQHIIFENTLVSYILFFALAIVGFTGISIDSYLYYSGLGANKTKISQLWLAYKFEVSIYVTTLIFYTITHFIDNTTINIIFTCLLILEALTSYFLSHFAKDKHNQVTKIVLIIFWLIAIILQ